MITFSENEINNQIKSNKDIFTIFKSKNGIAFIIQFLNTSSAQFSEANKVFIKILQIIIEKESNAQSNLNSFALANQTDNDLLDYFNLIIFCFGKFEKNNGILIYLLEILKKIITNKKIKETTSTELLDIMFKILHDTNSGRIAANGLHILDLVLKNSDYHMTIRNKNPLNLIVRILTNFRNDNIVSFHACGFLSKILEKDDVNNFLKIIKIKNVKNFDVLNSELDIDSFLPEIKEILSSEDNENKLNSLKKNIVRVLILMSKDKNFLLLLKDINCLDIFIKLLKSDLEIISLKNEKQLEDQKKEGAKEIEMSKYAFLEKKLSKKISKQDILANNLDENLNAENILIDNETGNLNEISIIENQLPEFFKLILSLLKNYEMIDSEVHAEDSIIGSSMQSTRNSIISRNSFYTSNNPNEKFEYINNFYNSALMKDVIWCLTKALKFYTKETDMIYEILDYLTNKDKIITNGFISGIGFSELNKIFVELFSYYYDTKWIYNYFYRLNNLIEENNIYNSDSIHPIIKDNNAILEGLLAKALKNANNKTEEESQMQLACTAEFTNQKEKEDFINNIFAIGVHLIFNTKSFEDNTFHDFYFSMLKIVENLELFLDDMMIEMAFINTIFCSIENKNFGESCEKINVLYLFLNKFLHLRSENLSEKSCKYILMRLNRLMENPKIENLNLIFQSELIIEVIILILNFITKTYSKKLKVDESFAKATISLIYFVLTKEGSLLVSRFFHDDGLIFLTQLSLIGVHDYDFNRTFIGIIQSFSNNFFKETSLFFRNFLALRKFISQLKEVKFSKGLNEKVYFDFLVLFKNIIKSCDFIEAVEDTLFLDHLINECNEIYCFYLDPRNRVIEMITEIISIFCKEKQILKNIVNSNYPMLLEKIIKNILDSGQEDYSDKMLEIYVGILTAFFKNNEFSKMIYSHNSKTLEYIKNIILNFKISEKNLIKLIGLFKIIVEYENSENLKERIMSIIFFRELSMKIPYEKEDLRNKIEECNMLIENPMQERNRRTFYDNNTKLLKELSDLVKLDRKKAVRKLTKNTHMTRTSNLSGNGDEIEGCLQKKESSANVENLIDCNIMKKSSIKINENSTLSYQFDRIINNLGNIIDYLSEKSGKFSYMNNIGISGNNVQNPSVNGCNNMFGNSNSYAQSFEFENEQISDFLKLIGIFAREDDNIPKICDNEILEKLINILENELILTYIKDQTISLLDKLSEHEYFIESFYKSGKGCEFLLRKFSNISGNYSHSEKSEFEKNFVNIITKILSKLSKDQIFIINNSDFLSFSNIYNILNELDFGKGTVSNILIILTNILLISTNSKYYNNNLNSNNNSKSTMSNLTNIENKEKDVDLKKSNSVHSTYSTINNRNSKSNVNNPNPNSVQNFTFIEGNSSKLSSLLIKLWKKFPTDIRVLEKIMKIIENLYLEEIIIRDFIDSDLLNSLNDILSDLKIDSDGIGNIFEMIDKLMFHRYFASKIIEQKSLYNISNTVYLNIFNTNIVEKGISILLKGSKTDKNFVGIMGFYGINEFCIKILNKYMTTCHSHIVKMVSELILILISDENNLRNFAHGENMDIILKAFKINLKSKEQVLICLKIVNFITTKDTEYSKHEVSRIDKKENLIKKKRDSFYNRIANNSIKISVNYDFTILIEIINEILGQYDEFYDIIMQLCELINNLFQISNEIWLKKFLMDVIINNEDKYLNKQEYIEIFLQTLYLMVKSDQSILEMDSQSILYFISKLMDTKLNMNLIIWIIKILKQLSKMKTINSDSNKNEYLKILDTIIKMENLHEDELIYYISFILSSLCLNTNFYLDPKSQNYFVFLLDFIAKKDAFNILQSKILEDMKNISVYFLIDDEHCAKAISETLVKLFDINLDHSNKKNLMNIFQITSALSIKSEALKLAFGELKLQNKIKELIEKDILQDTMLEYQAKGCLVNLKVKKIADEHQTMKKSSTLKTLNISIEQTEVNENLTEFLKTERQIKLYTDRGEIKPKTIAFNYELNCISAFTKKNGKTELLQQMNLSEMESCVRSCTTTAFSKAKGLFTKKPKPARCFSILGIKSLSGQRTFNVECDNEEDCIKYVDYITILIQNLKANNNHSEDKKDGIQNKLSSSQTVKLLKTSSNLHK